MFYFGAISHLDYADNSTILTCALCFAISRFYCFYLYREQLGSIGVLFCIIACYGHLFDIHLWLGR